MNSNHSLLAERAIGLASLLPHVQIHSLAQSIGQLTGQITEQDRLLLLQTIAHAGFRSSVDSFLNAACSSGSSPDAISAALMTAAVAERQYSSTESAQLVWTGPESQFTSFRHTEQAILEVLDSATKQITLVAFAVYRIPRICDSLVRAAARGVSIRVILETPDRIAGEHEYSTLAALGDEVARCATVYYWPKKNRAVNEAGRCGILHVKCAIADGNRLLLSSANLTEYAFSLNMELGLLIMGGDTPIAAEEHFCRLIESKTLERI